MRSERSRQKLVQQYHSNKVLFVKRDLDKHIFDMGGSCERMPAERGENKHILLQHSVHFKEKRPATILLRRIERARSCGEAGVNLRSSSTHHSRGRKSQEGNRKGQEEEDATT